MVEVLSGVPESNLELNAIAEHLISGYKKI